MTWGVKLCQAQPHFDGLEHVQGRRTGGRGSMEVTFKANVSDAAAKLVYIDE